MQPKTMPKDVIAIIIACGQMSRTWRCADWVFGVALAPPAPGPFWWAWQGARQLLTCSRDKTAKVWDLNARESVVTFPTHQNAVYGVAVSAEKRWYQRLRSCSGRKVSIQIGKGGSILLVCSPNASAEANRIRPLNWA